MALRIGIVGMGYWGPNLARNLATLESCELAWCCELDDTKRSHLESAYPQTRFTPDLDDLLNDPDLSAIVVATPGSTHAAVARSASWKPARTALWRNRSPRTWPRPSGSPISPRSAAWC